MSEHFPALIIVFPLLAAFIVAATGWFRKTLCFPICLASLAAALLVSIRLLSVVLDQHSIQYRLGGWPPPWGIAYEVDYLNSIVLVVVFAVAFINLIATRGATARDFSDRLGVFYALYLLFVTGLAGIVVTGDAFNLYVLLEIAALTGYALIGMGDDHSALASLHYVFMGTIGASFYLLGIGYLYLVTGSLNMADIAAILPKLYTSRVVLVAFIICMTGLFIKMALFPFHTWLPNAYTYTPSTAISLIAPLTTKVMIYVMIRITLFVFTPAFTFASAPVNTAFVWLASAGIVAASILALSERRLKRFLTYVLIAEVGYMVGGFWLANRAGITGAILHIINDAAMTFCVFLAAGNFVYILKDDSFQSLQGLFRKMPFSMAAFVVAALSIIGVPPTCGFFSKWYLISGGIAAGQYVFGVALLFSRLGNVVLFFRVIEIGFFEPFSDHHHDKGEAAIVRRSEAPLGMVLSLFLVAAALVVLGIYTGDIVTEIIQYAIPKGIA
ncbi:MAG: monovalent cation/H+ antiporter subunit D family protein [Deltaproteobacteria bacterium]|nr:monovalent cation/H+ antiporter subunit D family protein [Deltaproteobacteria bacterium]